MRRSFGGGAQLGSALNRVSTVCELPVPVVVPLSFAGIQIVIELVLLEC
jgi:hypothetical protein